MLSVTDYRLIQQQCENQHATTPRDFIGMTAAYLDSRQSLLIINRETLTLSYLLSLIKMWGYMVDSRNVSGWRQVGVQIGNDIKIDAFLIPHQMEMLTHFIIEEDLTPTEAYKQFEDIHPFIDGNGRVGHILWAWYTSYLSGEWPQTLPPDVFNQGIEGAALDPDGNAPPEDEQR